MSALTEHEGQGRSLVRGMPFSRGALMERNYIDCIALVHERDLLQTTGPFDETLRRNVDWDLFIRLGPGDRLRVPSGHRHRVRRLGEPRRADLDGGAPSYRPAGPSTGPYRLECGRGRAGGT